MLIQRINKFIADLRSTNNIYDLEAQTLFHQYFKDKDPNTDLTATDQNFILTHFFSRWRRYKHSDMNYTLQAEGDNLLWIELAKELALVVKKSYIKILFPDIEIATDPISKELLSDTINTDSLFLGYGDRTLYRKKSLCKFLIQSDYVLSILRSNSSGSSIVSVEELTRLKLCKRSIRGEFSIGATHFSSFWDFLELQVFSKLNPANELPLLLIPNFILLIEHYFIFKKEARPFNVFKKELIVFFEFLYKNELKLVNHFYGLRLGAERNQRLLDLLISLNTAQDYSIDDKLIQILRWLFTINPKLKLESFSSMYPEIVIEPLKPLIQCKLLLLSLFTFKFECPLWDARIISLSDKTNKVISAVAGVYNKFEPSIQADNIDGLLRVYNEVLSQPEDHFKGSCVSEVFSFVFSPVTTPWFDHIKAGSIANIGIDWYDPKLLIHGLVRFSSSNLYVSSLTDIFLDELVHTYCQGMSKLEGQLRINILFTEFKEKIKGTSEYKLILLALELYSSQDYKSSFLPNCTYYVGSRLKKIDVISSGSPTLFPTTQKMDSVTLKTAELEIRNVSQIISIYKEQIKMVANAELYEKLLAYLQGLCTPILTHREIEEVERSIQVADPLGAPT